MLAEAGGSANAGSTPRLTALSYLLGGSSVLVGDSLGGIQSFMPVRAHAEDINPRYTRVRVHEPAPAGVRGFETAAAAKAFLAWDDQGGIRAVHNTSQRVYFRATAGQTAPQMVHLSPKNNGVFAAGTDGSLLQWWVDAGHIEISLKTLFGKVHYEGHDAPKYEWQSHAGTDDVEVKMSLVPLLMGTVKGGLYALLFALPLALLGAIYTSEFMHPRLRGVVKPAMEVMAALPSVVLGFLGALYFAPQASPILPSLLLAVVLGPLSFMFFGWVFGQLPPSVTSHFGPSRTIASLVVVAAVALFLAMNLGPYAESWVFPATEAANPALVDPMTFAPRSTEATAALSGGSFQAWTDGGRELSRDTVAAGAKLPKGWWIPGGHNLFLCLLALPCALLAAWALTRLHGAVAPRLGGGCPVQKLRLALGGGGTGLRSVAANIVLSLGFWAVAAGLGLGLSALAAPAIESVLFGYDHPTAGHVADFRRFLTGPEGWKFSKTNSLIVGFSMGFAVIPIIYSIAEDSLSSVPNQLRAASLACGASRWQTTMRVVVPSAASGIFSAIVIGLGRALGETMIVVMAAGGTPVTDLQPLSGFRSLAAAIAIEMPEAPHGSSHYRVLFLAGLMLFAMTFVISTLSELVRMRLRKKMNRM
ncbi:MAG: ABC transporter permease subunit [Planctomycetes bacterium]|nr:ABC transporter permease subunit [Planctomycetota bacterium]